MKNYQDGVLIKYYENDNLNVFYDHGDGLTLNNILQIKREPLSSIEFKIEDVHQDVIFDLIKDHGFYEFLYEQYPFLHLKDDA